MVVCKKCMLKFKKVNSSLRKTAMQFDTYSAMDATEIGEELKNYCENCNQDFNEGEIVYEI